MAQDFSGQWSLTCWHPSSDDSTEEENRYEGALHTREHGIVFESKPNEDGSYMLARITVDGNLATGSWHSGTPPKSDFNGMMYSGAGQLLLSDDGNTMEGMWAGAGLDRSSNKPRVYTGRWRLERLGH
jgi:hypothetical protein